MLTASRYLPALFWVISILFFVAMIVTGQTVAYGLATLLAGAAALALERAFREAAKFHNDEKARVLALEQQVRADRDVLENLIEELNIAVFTCDARGQIFGANQLARDMFNFQDPSGRTVLAVTLSGDLQSLVDACVATGEIQRGEITSPFPNERVVVAEVWQTPDKSRIYLTLYEITDLRRLERVRTDFVANVSHELRTPLTTIRLMAETLQTDDDVNLRNRYLNKIIDEVDRLSSIAGDLLILTAAESNPVRKQTCDLAEVVRSVVHQWEPRALEKSLALSFEGPLELTIEANPAQMTQVAINLVDNAVSYTPAGRVEVSVYEDGEDAVLEVRDTGLGIPSEDVGRIFERFYRVDKGRSRGSGGTGLGLSIVRHIVEAHGGSVNVQSALNEGSTFTVRLPRPV